MDGRRFTWPFVIGALVALFGAAQAVSWALQIDGPVLLAIGMGRIGLNTPVMLLPGGLCTMALAVEPQTGTVRDRLVLIGGAVLVAYPALILSQSVFGISLGLDFVRVPTPPTEQTPHPGRVSPNACLGFISAGVAVLLAREAPAVARLAAFNIALLTMGLVAGAGIVGHLLGLEMLYRLASFNRLLPPTAFGLLTLAAALWHLRDRLNPHSEHTPHRLQRRITERAVIVLTLASLSAGIAGFVVMRETFEKSVRQTMLLTTRTNADAIAETLKNGLAFTRSISGNHAVENLLGQLGQHPDDAPAAQLLSQLAAGFVGAGFSGAEVQDRQGQRVVQVGRLTEKQGAIVHPLQLPGMQADLRWEQGYVLHAEAPVQWNGNVVGRIVSEQRLQSFDRLLAALRATDESSDALVCGLQGQAALCAPTRFYPQPFHVPMYDAQGRPRLPINRALLGETGVLITKDLRGIPVVAGYTPLQGLGLGLVVKTDVDTLYAPLKARVNQLTVLLLALVGLGTAALLARVRPLLSQVMAEQQRTLAVKQRLRAITDNVPALIAQHDTRERYLFANAHYKSLLGLDPAELLGRTMAESRGPEYMAQVGEHVAAVLRGQRVTFEMQLQIDGQTRYYQQNYVPDLDPEGRVMGFYSVATDITAAKEVERRLSEMARHDQLTGLPNRRQFDERLPEVLTRARRNRTGLALMFLDVDHFKSINDTLGHATGDAVLVEFGKRLKHSVRGTDTVARLAGDEFVVILEGLSADDEAEHVAGKIVTAMREPFRVGDRTISITTSVGVAFHEDCDATPEDLLAAADSSLYEAKTAGRNTFRLFARPGRRLHDDGGKPTE